MGTYLLQQAKKGLHFFRQNYKKALIAGFLKPAIKAFLFGRLLV
jgi:hypothetical protein